MEHSYYKYGGVNMKKKKFIYMLLCLILLCGCKGKCTDKSSSVDTTALCTYSDDKTSVLCYTVDDNTYEFTVTGTYDIGEEVPIVINSNNESEAHLKEEVN